MQVDVRVEAQPAAKCRDDLDAHLEHNAEHVAHRENDEPQLLVHGYEEGVDAERRGDDDVVQRGREVAPEVLAVGVVDACEDAGERVQQELDSEDAEEPYCEVGVEVAGRVERLQPYELRGEDDGERDDHGECEPDDA